jgi:hypothetical protein
MPENFRFTYLLAISAIAFLVFVFLGRGNTRPAYFFSISLPGAFILPVNIVWDALDPNIRAQPFISLLAALKLALIFAPGLWVFPMVLGNQIADLVKGVSPPITRLSAAGALLLALQYVWFDLLYAFAKSFNS